MMKKYLVFLFSFSLVLIYAQEFKLKRGEILIKGKPAAKISEEKGLFTVSDKENRPVYTIKFIDKAILDSIRDNYIELNRFYNPEKTISIDYESPSFFSGDEKSAVYTCVEVYDIIDEKGINIKKLDELFTTVPKRKLENKLKDAYTLRNKFNKMQLKVNNVGEVLSKGNRVGYFTNLPVTFSPDGQINEKMNNDIELYDAKNKLVGRYITTTKQIKTANGKSFTLYKDVSGRASLLKNPTYQNVIERIIVMDPNFIKG